MHLQLIVMIAVQRNWPQLAAFFFGRGSPEDDTLDSAEDCCGWVPYCLHISACQEFIV